MKIKDKVICTKKDLGMGQPRYQEKLRITGINLISRDGEYCVKTIKKPISHYARVSGHNLVYASIIRRIWRNLKINLKIYVSKSHESRA